MILTDIIFRSLYTHVCKHETRYLIWTFFSSCRISYILQKNWYSDYKWIDRFDRSRHFFLLSRCSRMICSDWRNCFRSSDSSLSRKSSSIVLDCHNIFETAHACFESSVFFLRRWIDLETNDFLWKWYSHWSQRVEAVINAKYFKWSYFLETRFDVMLRSFDCELVEFRNSRIESDRVWCSRNENRTSCSRNKLDDCIHQYSFDFWETSCLFNRCCRLFEIFDNFSIHCRFRMIEIVFENTVLTCKFEWIDHKESS